ncbi:MAG: thiamine-phosphate kinase [Acidobacteriaceae bacterium]|nr:thiamine-phosphate kinase [Acidobacteriaceae bacterium]
MKQHGELALIERIRLRARSTLPASRKRLVPLGIGDDCAILAPPAGSEVVVTTDFSLEGRHFTLDRHPAASIGHRVLARGLSDLAAMGAQPLSVFLSLALPRSLSLNTRWLDGFLDGLLDLARKAKAPLAGGDTSESPSGQLLLDIVALGTLPAGTALRRQGARPGDRIYVSGALGGAAAELAVVLSGKRSRQPSHPHLYPEPRLRTGWMLRERRLATACMDLSDGLSTDLAHLCRASGVAAEIMLDQLPLHPLSRRASQPERLRMALHGGEDYELLFTAPADRKLPRSLGGVPLTCIGTIVSARPKSPILTQIDNAGRRSALLPGGWEHLR